MIDNPTTTPGTPDAVRVMEQAAMRLYRDAHPDGVPWQELSDQTRVMWVAHAEQGAALSDELLYKEARLALGHVPANRYRNDLLKLMRRVIAADRAARGGAA